jgi:hypothetical protein
VKRPTKGQITARCASRDLAPRRLGWVRGQAGGTAAGAQRGRAADVADPGGESARSAMAIATLFRSGTAINKYSHLIKICANKLY